MQNININIIVIGKTGAGKSTLINSAYKEELALTGSGKPITQHIQKYQKEDFPITIYDTKGLELSEKVQKEVFDEIMATINQQEAKNNANERIHCLWYCISASSDRVEEEEIKLIKKLSAETNLPIILIITKCYNKKNTDAIIQTIKSENIRLADIIPVQAIEFTLNDEYLVKSFGFEKLRDKMAEILPETYYFYYNKCLQKAHRQHMENILIYQTEEARTIINRYAITASGLAATPVPFSDAFTLIPTQVAMIAHITSCFDMKLDKSILTGLVTAVIGTSATTFLGKTIVSNALKFIPFVGSVAGGAISASTAGLLTKALGEAYLVLITKVASNEISLEELSSEKGKELFITEVKNKLAGMKFGK